MMCPGKFPSPISSREASPAPTPPNPLDIMFSHTGTSHRVPSLDFTASAASRKRPYFADTQSEPVLSKASRTSPTSTSSHLTARSHAHGKHRVSDSAYSPPRYNLQPSVHKPKRQTFQRRVVSAQSAPTSPESPPRTSSAARIQLPVSESSYLIDVRLREKLRSPLTFTDIPPLFGASSKVGSIYVLFDPSKPQRGTKIGWSRRPDYIKRIDEHHICGFTPEVFHVSHDIINSFRAEQLIHLELMDRRLTWSCTQHKPTATVHDEWYDISHVEARDIVMKWAGFMNKQNPYDWRRCISPLWEYLLKRRALVIGNGFGHDERREQWRTLLRTPTQGEYVCFIIDVLRRISCAARDVLRKNLPYCMAYFWQMLTLVYSFATMIVCRNTFASSAFVLVSVCAYLSIWSKLPLKRVRSKSG